MPTTPEDMNDVHSHHSSAIPDEEKVTFRPNEGPAEMDIDLNDSRDSMDENMVYYEKEDMTNYSKTLRLNRVQERNKESNLS
jgi:hypothetical protein